MWCRDHLYLLRVNPPILLMCQVPCNCIELRDAKSSATHIHPLAAIKHISQPLPCHHYLAHSPFPSVLIPLHIAVLKRCSSNKLKIATITFRFVNVCWPLQPNTRHLQPLHLHQLVELVYERVRHPFRIMPSRWSSRNWLWYIFVSFSYVFALFFCLSFPAPSC